MVALIWSGSSVLVQAIFTTADFRKPFFLTFVANSLFMVTLPLRGLAKMAQRARRGQEIEHYDQDSIHLVESSLCSTEVRRAAKSGLLVAPVWFAANCTYNFSMSMTSITSSTVISSSSSAFTLLLSVVVLRERFTVLKVCGVVLCWLGNGLTAFSDTSGTSANMTIIADVGADDGGADASATLRGDLICLFSAVLYALYTVLIKWLAPPDLALFFGFLGFATFILFGPFVVLLHLSHIEDLSSLTPAISGLLLLKGLLDNVLSDYLWYLRGVSNPRLPDDYCAHSPCVRILIWCRAASVMLTSPSVATVGMSLTVPLAILSDLLLPRAWLVDPVDPTATSVLAAIAVVGGFVAIAAAGGGAGGDGDGRSCDIALHAPLLGGAADAPRSDSPPVEVSPVPAPDEPEHE